MITDSNTIIEGLVSKALNVKDYKKIITTFKEKNISLDMDFQKTFNRFFIVRRNADWRESYYSYFEDNKLRKDITFEEILYYLYKTTGQIEHSFSSKMLAIINPDMPIWDIYVLNYVGLKTDGQSKEDQLKNRVEVYDKIIQWYDRILTTSDADQIVTVFDNILPEYRWLTPTKKIDFIIWGMRD